MDEEISLNISDYLEIIKKRKKIIILITLLSVVMTSIISFFILKPVYEAQTTIIVGKAQDSKSSSADYSDTMMYQNLIKTYASIAQSQLVAEKTIEGLSTNITAGELEKKITVTPQTGTQILLIKTQDQNPKQAMDITNAVADAFIYESKVVFPTGGDIQIMDKATLPQAPVKPNKKLNIAISFFLGLMVSIGLSFLLESLDNTISTENDIEKFLDLPVIGMIPKQS